MQTPETSFSSQPPCRYLDPTLEQDLASPSQPWALSPLISTVPYLVHARTGSLEGLSPFPPITPISDCLSDLPVRNENGAVTNFNPEWGLRQSYFKTAENRNKVTFGPEVGQCRRSLYHPIVSDNPNRTCLQLTSVTTTSISILKELCFESLEELALT